jgi:putative ABC transport system permease protein
MFDFETAIKAWKKALAANPGLEDGQRAELETCLRDEVADLIRRGRSPEEAFRQVTTEMGSADAIGLEFFKVYAKRRFGPPSWRPSRFSPALVWNYIIIALRKIKRQKGYSFINIAGLALGMACSILIMLWVQDERSFDRFHPNFREIYRVVADWPKNDWKGVNASPMPLAPLAKEQIPGIAEAVRVTDHSRKVVRYKDKMFYESRGIIVDPAFFKVFRFPFVKGDPETAFRGPSDLVMTASLARKYFGDEDPLGKTVLVEGKPAVVTGVVADVPPQSTFQFDFASSFAFVAELTRYSTHWGALNFDTYLLLEKGAGPQPIGPKLTEIAAANGCPQVKKGASFRLQPFAELHLDARPYTKDTEILGDRRLVQLFSVIAAAILLIACVNFMNLSTARAAVRAKEVGVRKTMGAARGQLARQFLGESFLLVGIALVVAVGLCLLVMPAFNQLAGKSLGLDFASGRQVLGLAVAFLLTGLVAGSYPSVVLSGLRPAHVLSGRGNEALGPGGRRSGGASFRRVLVVFQFALSIVLLVGTITVHKQIRFIRDSDLGFDLKDIIQIPLKGTFAKQFPVFKTELRNLPSVASVTAENYPFSATAYRSAGNFDWEGREGRADMDFIYAGVDEDFFTTLGLKVVAGRAFSSDFPNDKSGAAILNEAAVAKMGLSEPIGKWFSSAKNERRTIVGVVRDAYFQSFHNPVEPRWFYLADLAETEDMALALVKLRGDDTAAAVAAIKKLCARLNPDVPFEFKFLSQTYQELYVKEQRAVRVLNIFTGLAVLISCLGLFGLAAFTAERRTKEIGVRKVLGAGEFGLVKLLTTEFSRWVLLANVVAWPVGYFAATKLLQGYVYRTGVGIGIFVSAGFLAWAIAVLTVCWQALRAARANPVESLRCE